jgi:hypothetical protein
LVDIKLEKISARDEMVLSGNAQIDGYRPRCDQDETPLQNIAGNFHRAHTAEAGPAVVSLNAPLGKTFADSGERGQ